MLTDINAFLQILTITTGTFLIERYVLLEPPMEPKKQKIFYIISFAVVLAVFLLTGGQFAGYAALLFGGLNIFLGRKKYRLPGFLLVIPLIGLMNGIGTPIFLVPLILGKDSEDPSIQPAVLCVYLAIGGLLALFYFKGKKWRKWFSDNMKERRPSAVEYVLIFVIGLLVTGFSGLNENYLYKINDVTPIEIAPLMDKYISSIYSIFLVTTFVLTVTLVIMIIQGNRRKFYFDKIEKMQFSVIATMADIVENRDENTGGHIKRTAKYVEIIGKKLRSEGKFSDKLTEAYLSDMIVAAPLHDIGKIHIPDAILNKPGKLTEEEFEIMKTHTTAGRDVLIKAKNQLGEFDYLNTAVEMAEYHHEWWNGKGYSQAISGEDIPLCARIMAVADVFDALTAKRCYKAAMPVEKAYSIIKEETGTHFDPVVAQAFLASKDKIEEALNSENFFDS